MPERGPGGWITARWTLLPMVGASFADFTWLGHRILLPCRGLRDEPAR
jgi:hypothetical protein